MRHEIDHHEAALQRMFNRCQPIPVLPPVIDGRTYFNKAADRREAMLNGIATDPRKPSKPRERSPLPPNRDKFHLEGSSCDLYSGWWSSERKLSIVPLADFERLKLSKRCAKCEVHRNVTAAY